ncbi:NAD(P)-binding protein [Daldinia caldariorum]|uniref:NAD(P)-binding protein n=1 Tax=Daldinia caldariorum TaxID=326644 RepID=UPI00200780E6|nr:NAD(P)-binding protein [Daldinia caldariorum]KAI1466598.1 NAD(P)-binding protein [Daldinia caldariorum]
MSKPWILVSPASRGIGHALTRHLLRTTSAPILATARTDLPGLRASVLDDLYPPSPHESTREKNEAAIASASERLHVARVDVADEATLESASADAARLFPPETHHLRLAFALPGVLYSEKSPRDIDAARALHTFQVNALGPLLLMKWFGSFLPRKSAATSAPAAEPLIFNPDTSISKPTFASSSSSSGSSSGGGSKGGPRHATWLTASARVGSTADNRLGGWYTYRASKAGVNSLTRTFDHHLRARSGDAAAAIAYHPGTVRTGLSREFWDRVPAGQLFDPQHAVERMLEVVRTRNVETDRGRCWDHRGEEVLP